MVSAKRSGQKHFLQKGTKRTKSTKFQSMEPKFAAPNSGPYRRRLNGRKRRCPQRPHVSTLLQVRDDEDYSGCKKGRDDFHVVPKMSFGKNGTTWPKVGLSLHLKLISPRLRPQVVPTVSFGPVVSLHLRCNTGTLGTASLPG